MASYAPPPYVQREIGIDPQVWARYDQLTRSKKKDGLGMEQKAAFAVLRQEFGDRATMAGSQVTTHRPVEQEPAKMPPALVPAAPSFKVEEPEEEDIKPATKAQEAAGFPGTRNPMSQVGHAPPDADELASVGVGKIDPFERALRWIDALSYEGYNPIAVRTTLRSEVGWSDTLRLIGVYIRVGNAASKRLGKKVKDRDVAAEARQLLSELQVKKSSQASDGLTLPRVAQAMAPVTLALRIAATKRNLLDQRVETTTPLEFQDVAFNGIYPQADDYCIKFGRVLGRAQATESKQVFDQEACDARNRGFREVARAGLMRDPHMVSALGESDVDTLQAWFENEGLQEW